MLSEKYLICGETGRKERTTESNLNNKNNLGDGFVGSEWEIQFLKRIIPEMAKIIKFQ